jgi:LacI family transcriptional regulator
MTTIRKIADIAGVSSATVSKVINGKDKHISSETRERILRIVEREGYIPNGIAKSLRIKNTRTLGLILPDVTNLFFSEVAKGIEDAAAKRGYSVILCNSDNNDDKEKMYLKILQEKMVDGIILTSSHSNIGSELEHVPVPIVLIDRDVQTDKPVGRITVDNELGGYLAAKLMLDKGCRSIGHITASLEYKPSAERYNGLIRALEEYGITMLNGNIFTGLFTIETGYEGAVRLMSSSKVDGIFCGNDLIAIGAMKALKEMGMRIPEDIRLVGFDDIALAKYTDPPLTTVRQPIYSLGENAIRVLIGMIEDGIYERTVVLQPELMERMSC